MEAQRLLSPATLASIRGLPLLARTVGQGFLHGAQPSRRRGQGAAFSQYRPYQPGDELRQLDWKLYARSGKYFLREADTESPVTLRLVLDVSASMRHEEDGITKLQYAIWLAAALAWLATAQGDAVGLTILPEAAGASVLPGYGGPHVQRIFHQLATLRATGTFPAAPTVWGGRGREVVIFVSDLYDEAARMPRWLGQLRGAGHEVMAFHLLGRQEQTFSYRGTVEFEDLETGRRLETDAHRLRPEYLKRLEMHLAQLQKQFRENGIEYRLFSTDEPLDVALRTYLLERDKLA